MTADIDLDGVETGRCGEIHHFLEGAIVECGSVKADLHQNPPIFTKIPLFSKIRGPCRPFQLFRRSMFLSGERVR